MDFENVTDTPEPPLNIPESQDPFLKPEDSGKPIVITPDSDQSGGPFNGDKKKLISMLIVSIFITLTIGAIIAYVVISTMNASKPKDDPYARYAKIAVPTKVFTPTALPLPTAVQTSTEEAEVEEDEPSEPIAETDWRIVLDEPEISLASLEDEKIATISASLFGPIDTSVTVCVENNRNTYQYFSKRKTAQVYEKVCQETIDSKEARFTCTLYEPEAGIAITEQLLPATNCSNSTAKISAGSYVIYSKVYYNCDITGKTEKAITESDCTDSIEINSEELTVTE